MYTKDLIKVLETGQYNHILLLFKDIKYRLNSGYYWDDNVDPVTL